MLQGSRVRPFVGLTLAGVVAFAAIGLFWLWKGDAWVVRTRVEAAVEAMNDDDLELARFLADDIVVEDERGLPVRGLNDVLGLASMLSSGGRRVTLSDVEVRFFGSNRATVTAAAHLTSPSTRAAVSNDGHRIQVQLEREGRGGYWLISRVRSQPPPDDLDDVRR